MKVEVEVEGKQSSNIMDKSKNRIIWIMIIVLSLILLAAVLYRARVVYKENKAEQDYDGVRSFVKISADSIDASEDGEDDSDSGPTKAERIEAFLDTGNNREKYEYYLKDVRPDFAAMEDKNSDVIAYVEIPETGISYPILQNVDDSYYLKNSFAKNDDTFGAIYIENCNSADWSDPITVVYGHHLSNGSLFGKLTEYKKKEYCEANPYFIIYTKDGVSVYEIVVTSKYSTDYLLNSAFSEDESGNMTFDGIDDGLGIELIDQIKAYGKDKAYVTQSEVTKEDKIVILSTCCDNSTRRFLVVGKKVL